MGVQGTAISRCCQLARRLMLETTPCVSEEINWGSVGRAPATSGPLRSEIAGVIKTPGALLIMRPVQGGPLLAAESARFYLLLRFPFLKSRRRNHLSSQTF